MGLTFDNLKKRVGKNIKYYDDTTGWLTGRDVTEADIGEFINEIYREKIFPLFATQYPEDFREVAHTDNSIVTGTVSASSTGTTLVASSGIFTNGMVGLFVWNATDEEATEITSYTSTTTVEVEATIGDTWDGDTIYVLGQEFSFGGDANDLYVLESVGLKFQTSDTVYQKARQYTKNDYYQTGWETGTQGSPIYYLTTITVAGSPYSGFGIEPKFQTLVTNAIEINYIKKPTTLSGSGDTMRLPIDTPVIYGATARAYEKKREFTEASYWMSKFELEMRTAISRYRPLSTSRIVGIRIPRRYGLMSKRLY